MTFAARLATRLTAALGLAALAVVCPPALADGHAAAETDEAITVGIITGQNNHQWFNDAPALKSILDQAGLFETTLIVTPDKADPDKAAKWAAFDPKFGDYDVIVINYNDSYPPRNPGDAWPADVQRSFERYIAGGGKAYSFHAANNAFIGWEEYEQMIGLLWRPANAGKRIYFDDQGNQVIQQPGEGPGAGHGRRHAYRVDTRDNEHPIFRGLPDQWMHAEDELYHGQRGPAENMTILLTAYNDPAIRGTGVVEPVVWTIPYGEGTVLTNVMGHWAGDGPALRCVGFQNIFTRSIEGLATGAVTQARPEDFPTADAVSMRDLTFEPIAHIHVPGVPGSDAHADCGCSPPTQPGFIPAWVQYAQMLEPVPDAQTAGH